MEQFGFSVNINNDGTATIHITNTTKKRMKILIEHNDKNIFYDIDFAIHIPLTFGNGVYIFQLYKQIVGKRYESCGIIKKEILFSNPYQYKLSSNDYVPFSTTSSFYKMAKQCNTWENILKYINKTFRYDYVQALLRAKTSFTTPDIEKCFQKKSGICYELAALTTAMARICGIPATLVIGTANNSNHAWVDINGKIYDITKEIQHNNKKYKYKSERCY